MTSNFGRNNNWKCVASDEIDIAFEQDNQKIDCS